MRSLLLENHVIFYGLKSICMHAKSLQSCLTLCYPMDCSLLGSSVHGILQARILEWIAMPSSRGSSQPRDRPSLNLVSYVSLALAGRFFTTSATWEAYTLKSIHSMTLSTKRFTLLRSQNYFVYNLPEYSEILSMSESHSQMEWMSQPTELVLQVPRFPVTHKFPFSKHHVQSRHLRYFVGPNRG